jgi:hypothetical protein
MEDEAKEERWFSRIVRTATLVLYLDLGKHWGAEVCS